MLKRISLLSIVSLVFALAVYATTRTPEADEPKPLPEMKFNDVKEIAPGVFFRYSSIAANDPRFPSAAATTPGSSSRTTSSLSTRTSRRKPRT